MAVTPRRASRGQVELECVVGEADCVLAWVNGAAGGSASIVELRGDDKELVLL
jgi:hypothetical protein